MAGGWASALGEAILRGTQSYQNTTGLQQQLAQRGFENQRLTANDAIENALRGQQQQQIQQTMALANEAASRQRAGVIEQTEGINAFDNPAYVAARTAGKVPLQVQPVPQGAPQFGGDGGDDGSGGTPTALSADELHKRGLGTTGAVIPEGAQLAHQQLLRNEAMEQMKLQMMADFSKTGGLSGLALGADGQPADTPENRDHAAMYAKVTGFTDPIVSRYGPASQAPSNVLARKNAEAEVPSATMQRFNTGTANAITHMHSAMREYEKLFPGINDPNVGDKYNSLLTDLPQAYLEGQSYKVRANPYNKAIQDANLGGLQEIANLVPGRMNPQIIGMAQQHIQQAGKETHQATYNRMKELTSLLQDNLRGGINPQQAVRDAMGAAAAPTQANPAAPPQANAAPTFGPGSKIPYSEVVTRASVLHMDPSALAQQLNAGGATVVR